MVTSPPAADVASDGLGCWKSAGNSAGASELEQLLANTRVQLTHLATGPAADVEVR